MGGFGRPISVDCSGNWPGPSGASQRDCRGFSPSMWEEGRATLHPILIKYAHVFPAPGEPMTGRTTVVQHDLETNGAKPVWCGPRRLAPAGLQTEQT